MLSGIRFEFFGTNESSGLVHSPGVFFPTAQCKIRSGSFLSLFSVMISTEYLWMNSAVLISSSLSKMCEISLFGVRSLYSSSSVSLLLSPFFSSKLAAYLGFSDSAYDYALELGRSWSGFP